MTAVVEERPLLLRDLGFADRACSACGWRFFTTAGLYEHEQTHLPPKEVSPALRDAGLKVAALNNARRRRCKECGYESTPAGVGTHQKAWGHVGWTEPS